MQRAERLRVIFVLILSLVGTAALFLPFTLNVSPWKALLKGWEWWYPFGLLGAPFSLAVPILAWQIRRLLTNQLSASELTAAYVLSAAAMLSVVTFTVLVMVQQGWEVFRDITFIVPAGACWVLAVANPLFLWRNLRNKVSREATAEALLLSGYLPNAVFCLLGFGLDGELQIGAYLIALVCIGYIAAIVVLSRRKPT